VRKLLLAALIAFAAVGGTVAVYTAQHAALADNTPDGGTGGR